MKEYLARIHKTDTDIVDLYGNEFERNNDTALIYNGTDSYTKIDLLSKINKDNFTIYLKFTVSSSDSNKHYIMNFGTIGLFLDADELYFSDSVAQVDLGKTDTNEHTLVFTRNGLNFITYLDGTKIGENSSPFITDFSNTEIYLGCLDKASSFFTGNITEFVIVKNYVSDGKVQTGNFKLGEFCLACGNWEKLTDEAKIEVFNNSKGEAYTSDEILSIKEPVKLLKYI